MAPYLKRSSYHQGRHSRPILLNYPPTDDRGTKTGLEFPFPPSRNNGRFPFGTGKLMERSNGGPSLSNSGWAGHAEPLLLLLL